MAASTTSSGDSEDDKCVICFQSITNTTRAAVKSCGHRSFCLSCITHWQAATKSTAGPCCPLCKAPAEVILKNFSNDGNTWEEEVFDWSQQQLQPKDAQEEEEEEAADLSCLDQRFFAEEVRGLMGFGREVVQVSPSHACSDHAAGILMELEETLTMLLLEDPFDPRTLLDHLYDLQQQLEKDKAGVAVVASAPPKLYGADNADEVSDDPDQGEPGWSAMAVARRQKQVKKQRRAKAKRRALAQATCGVEEQQMSQSMASVSLSSVTVTTSSSATSTSPQPPSSRTTSPIPHAMAPVTLHQHAPAASSPRKQRAHKHQLDPTQYPVL